MEIIIMISITLALLIFIILRARKPKYVQALDQDEFKKNYRKAQLIDIREEREFQTGYILGARNIPLSQFKQRNAEIRPDQPVYLYCQNGSRIAQAARILKKQRNVETICYLKGGFKKWSGKIKK